MIISRSGSTFLAADEEAAANLRDEYFNPAWWRERDRIIDEAHGRGTVYFVQGETGEWALRHYLRGGWMARISRDHYIWSGLNNTRPWREFHLLATLRKMKLPVPRPIGARVVRSFPWYSGDLLTERIPSAKPLASLMQAGPIESPDWQRIGTLLARFHEHGVRHDDINVNNILLDKAGALHLIDFDNALIVPRGPWIAQNLARFHRSIEKLRRRHPSCAFHSTDWEALMEGYGADQPLTKAVQSLID